MQSTAVLCVSGVLPLSEAGVAQIASQGQRATVRAAGAGAATLRTVAGTPLETGVGNPMGGSVLL